jgi:hypothetical protein
LLSLLADSLVLWLFDWSAGRSSLRVKTHIQRDDAERPAAWFNSWKQSGRFVSTNWITRCWPLRCMCVFTPTWRAITHCSAAWTLTKSNTVNCSRVRLNKKHHMKLQSTRLEASNCNTDIQELRVKQIGVFLLHRNEPTLDTIWLDSTWLVCQQRNPDNRLHSVRY